MITAEYAERALHYWRAGGPLLLPLAIVCFGIWFIFLRTRSRLTALVSGAGGLEDDLLKRLASGEALMDIRDDLAFRAGELGGMLASVLDSVARGGRPPEAFDSLQESVESGLRRDSILLKALTAVAPLIGLLGTVVGMIETFQAVAQTGGDTAARVAGGISRALITTQCGLVVAIPGVFGLTRIGRLTDRVRIRIALCRTHVIMGLEQRRKVVEAGA